MKALEFNQLEIVIAGNDAACGAAVAAAIIFPGPWTLGGVVLLCLTGDTPQ